MQYGRYHVVKELGKGTMGVVYQAHDPQIDRMVALKILRPDKMASQGFVTRFLKEAKAIGRLSHPRIVTVFDVGEDKGTIYIAMEYLSGQPFNEVIRSGRLTVGDSIDIGCQVADALDYAHGKGIVHRDIKPSNIILNEGNEVKLTDFGIARIEDTAAGQQTQAGEILGTPVYMSPEQVKGMTVDGRSDLYSLGVILYELVVGHRPFEGNNIAAIFHAIAQQEPAAPADEDPFVSKKLNDLILKSIAKSPDERFQNGRQMIEALQRAKPLADGQVSTPVEPPIAKASKKGWMAALAGLLILAAIAGWWWMRGPADDGQRQQQASTLPASSAQNNGVDDQVAAEQETLSGKEAATSVLVISSEPSGAHIFVDGNFMGDTPSQLPLAFGKYEVRINLADYYEWEAQLKLDKPGQTPLQVRLIPVN